MHCSVSKTVFCLFVVVLCLFLCLFLCLCMYVHMFTCMRVRMYVCMDGWMDVSTVHVYASMLYV